MTFSLKKQKQDEVFHDDSWFLIGAKQAPTGHGCSSPLPQNECSLKTSWSYPWAPSQALSLSSSLGTSRILKWTLRKLEYMMSSIDPHHTQIHNCLSYRAPVGAKNTYEDQSDWFSFRIFNSNKNRIIIFSFFLRLN